MDIAKFSVPWTPAPHPCALLQEEHKKDAAPRGGSPAASALNGLDRGKLCVLRFFLVIFEYSKL